MYRLCVLLLNKTVKTKYCIMLCYSFANQKEHGRVTKDGFFVVRSDMTRKQMLNQADCLNKLRNMIYKASELPREPTTEEMELKEKR